MKCLALTLLTLVVASCQPKPQESDSKASSQPASKSDFKVEQEVPSTAIERDLDRICNAVEQSGALDLQPGERAMHVGIWLAQNIESQEARTLSAELTQLGPDERIARLERELGKHGIGTCEIFHAWR